MEGEKNTKAKTYQLKLHLIPFFNDKHLNKIYSFDIGRYKKLSLSNNAAPGTINRELSSLSHLFTKAIEWEWLDQKPANIKRCKENQG